MSRELKHFDFEFAPLICLITEITLIIVYIFEFSISL